MGTWFVKSFTSVNDFVIKLSNVGAPFPSGEKNQTAALVLLNVPSLMKCDYRSDLL